MQLWPSQIELRARYRLSRPVRSVFCIPKQLTGTRVHNVDLIFVGVVSDIDALVLGLTCCEMGAGRQKSDDQINYGAGLQLYVQVGSPIQTGTYRSTSSKPHLVPVAVPPLYTSVMCECFWFREDRAKRLLRLSWPFDVTIKNRFEDYVCYYFFTAGETWVRIHHDFEKIPPFILERVASALTVSEGTLSTASNGHSYNGDLFDGNHVFGTDRVSRSNLTVPL